MFRFRNICSLNQLSTQYLKIQIATNLSLLFFFGMHVTVKATVATMVSASSLKQNNTA